MPDVFHLSTLQIIGILVIAVVVGTAMMAVIWSSSAKPASDHDESIARDGALLSTAALVPGESATNILVGSGATELSDHPEAHTCCGKCHEHRGGMVD